MTAHGHFGQWWKQLQNTHGILLNFGLTWSGNFLKTIGNSFDANTNGGADGEGDTCLLKQKLL